ncbi:MAG TPA: hypothetical protein VHG08_00485 [Longimicrobium sp.]|nr:hypothetical protein [Longimicrobium sp.]
MAIEIAGTVQSGGNQPGPPIPQAGVTVTVFQTTPGMPTTLGSAKTAEDGTFSASVPDPAGDSILYAVAQVSASIALVTIIGPEVAGPIVINELTTVAAAFSMAQFAQGTSIAGNAFGLRIAAMMNDNLVDTLTGEPSAVLQNPPNADQTNTLRSTRSLANLVAACVRRRPGVEARFTVFTTPLGHVPAPGTFQGLLNIARYPANNAKALYNQSQGVPSVYSPPLFSAPDAWTLAVKVNDSGAVRAPEAGDQFCMFGGPANIVFDRNGYAWIANNVFQGTPNSGNFIIVLQPDGKPARGGNGLPTSPVFGGGLQGPGWGITIDPNQHVWVGNFGWGNPETEFPQVGSVSEFKPDGTPLSIYGGYYGDWNRAQAVVSDADGNIWIASFGSGEVVLYPSDRSGQSTAPAGTGTFGIALARDGTAWVSAGGGGLGWPTAFDGSVSRFRLDGTKLTQVGESVTVGKANKVIAVDSLGNAWLASGGDNTVYQFNKEGQQVGAFSGVGGMDAPWGLCVDGDDHVWVGNFGALGPESDYTYAGLTKLAGANPATRPAGLNTGDPISPPTGYTLPSAGDPVLLNNGDPLYRDGTECYSPFMRTTSCQIDQAGNVWVVNNWKPRFETAFEPNCGNPGGDGVVIFVGLARPPVPPPWIGQADQGG